jgi:hypothetical protein
MAAERRAPREPGPLPDWAADTSGFGVSKPPAVPAPAPRRNSFGPVSRFLPSRWLG